MGTICNVFLREKLCIHSFIQHIECIINYINNNISVSIKKTQKRYKDNNWLLLSVENYKEDHENLS